MKNSGTPTRGARVDPPRLSPLRHGVLAAGGVYKKRGLYFMQTAEGGRKDLWDLRPPQWRDCSPKDSQIGEVIAYAVGTFYPPCINSGTCAKH